MIDAVVTAHSASAFWHVFAALPLAAGAVTFYSGLKKERSAPQQSTIRSFAVSPSDLQIIRPNLIATVASTSTKPLLLATLPQHTCLVVQSTMVLTLTVPDSYGYVVIGCCFVSTLA